MIFANIQIFLTEEIAINVRCLEEEVKETWMHRFKKDLIKVVDNKEDISNSNNKKMEEFKVIQIIHLEGLKKIPSLQVLVKMIGNVLNAKILIGLNVKNAIGAKKKNLICHKFL